MCAALRSLSIRWADWGEIETSGSGLCPDLSMGAGLACAKRSEQLLSSMDNADHGLAFVSHPHMVSGKFTHRGRTFELESFSELSSSCTCYVSALL